MQTCILTPKLVQQASILSLRLATRLFYYCLDWQYDSANKICRGFTITLFVWEENS